MGNFGGHALPGSFFIVFGLWWTVQIFYRYYSCRRRNARFYSSPTFPCNCLCGKLKEWPVEGIVKIFFVIIGFFLEIYTGFRDGKFVMIGNGQHATMFFFFGLTGVVDILTYFRAPMPPKTDYVMMAMALMCEGLLFKFHLHGRTELDVLVHILLLYTVYANIISVIVEMKFGHNVLSPLARAYFIILQGTWFWQVGFILYPPFPGLQTWKEDDHEQMMLATLMFTWHAGAIFLLMLLIGGVMACLHRQAGGFADDELAMKRLIHTGANGQTMVSLNDDSDSDVEFQKPVSTQ